MLRQFRKISWGRLSASGLNRLLILIAALSVAIVFHSCRNPGSSSINSRTEIERFMNVNQDIREFFDLDIYARDTFVLDSGSATFRVAEVTEQKAGDFIVRLSRRADTTGSGISIPDTTASGVGRTAFATREDRYNGVLVLKDRLTGKKAEFFYQSSLTRTVLFQELGSDDDPFLGWEFIGLSLGKSLAYISELVSITRIPARGGFPTVLSDQQPEDFLKEQDELLKFTYLFHVKSVNAGDSIDVVTKLGPMTIFARTNAGFRQLSGRPGPAGTYHYGFRTPPADPQNRFYQLLTFQTGPEIAIDSLRYNRFVTGVNVTPPDTQIDSGTYVDTLFDSSFIYRDTCVDTALIDTTLLDTCSSREVSVVDSIPDTMLFADTTILPAIFDTIFDSVLAPPDTSVGFEDLWTFPYSVR